MSAFDKVKNIFKFAAKETPSNLDAELALSDPFNLFTKDQFYQYNPNTLVRSKGLAIFDKIRRDEQAKAALLFKKHAVMASGWSIAPADGYDVDHEAVEFIDRQFRQLSGTLERNIQNILTALDYGYSITEKIFFEIDEGPDAGMIGLKALKTRKPHSFKFKQDEFGNIANIIQQTNAGAGFNELPVEKFVIYSYQDDFGNPYGTSDLDSAYRPWWFKDHAYKWLGMYLERFGIPPIFALYNRDKYNGSTINKLKDALKNLQAATSGVIPRQDKDDLELWTPEVAGQASRVFIPVLEKYDTDIAKAILMPGQLGVSPDAAVGSQARAIKIFEMWMMIIDTLRNEIAETIINEQIVKPLYYYNYENPDECPQFKWNPIDDEANLELLKTWGDMVGSAVVINTPEDEAHIRNSMKFPERDMTNDPEPERQITTPTDGDDEPGEDDEPEPDKPKPKPKEKPKDNEPSKNNAADDDVDDIVFSEDENVLALLDDPDLENELLTVESEVIGGGGRVVEYDESAAVLLADINERIARGERFKQWLND